MIKNLTIALAAAIIGSLVTVIGQPYVEKILERTEDPVLGKDISIPNIEDFPAEIRGQINFVTARYELRHVSGGTARNITIDITATRSISPQDLVFAPRSEPYLVQRLDSNILRINMSHIRPDRFIAFQLALDPGDRVGSSETSDNAEVRPSLFISDEDDANIYLYIFVSILLIVVVFALYILDRLMTRGFQWIRQSESTNDNIAVDRKNKLIFFLVTITVYNVIANVQGLLPASLPRIYISDLFYALSLYVIISNYGSISLFFNKYKLDASESDKSEESGSGESDSSDSRILDKPKGQRDTSAPPP